MIENDDPAYDAKMAKRNVRGRSMMAKCGYNKGGAVKETVKKGVSEHESHLHKHEKKTKLKLKDGGRADGEHGKHKMHYKDGGHVKGKKGVTVNVMVSPSAPPPAEKVPVPIPAGGGAPPPRPPMGAPAGGPPMGGPPPMGGAPGGMPPRPPMKSGGRVKQLSVKDGGAGGAEGRMKKISLYGGKKGA